MGVPGGGDGRGALWASQTKAGSRGRGHSAERRGNNQGGSSAVGSLLLRMGCGERGSPVPESALKHTGPKHTGGGPGHVRGRTSEVGLRPQG